MGNTKITRPSVNHAKDWLGQLFLIPGLVWSGKEYRLWMWSLWGSQQAFSCVLGLFRHGDNQTTTKCQSCTSLLWASEKTVFCKNTGDRAGWFKRPTFSAELLVDFPYSFILITIIIIICSPSPLYRPFPNQGHCDIFRWRHQLLSTINTQIKGKLKY